MKYLVHLWLLLVIPMGNIMLAQHQLQYNFSVGDQFKMSQNAEQDMIMEVEGSKHTTHNSISGTYDFEVIEATENGYVITSSFTSLIFKSESDLIGTVMDVDTNRDVDKDDMEAQIFQALLNTPFEIHMLKTGEITSLKNTEAIIENMITKIGVEDDFTKDLMRKSLGKEFGGESLAESMEQLLYLYSPSPVKVGDTWKNDYSGELTANNTWTLENYNDATFTITATAPVVFANGSDADVAMDLTGNQQTNATIETTTGFPKEVSVNQSVEGTAIMMGTEVPTKLISTITYKRI